MPSHRPKGDNRKRRLAFVAPFLVIGLRPMGGHRSLPYLRCAAAHSERGAEVGNSVKLSKESEYGLKGVLFLAALPEGEVRSAGEVAEATGVAFPFLAKIFNRLGRGGILTSHRGRSRGYALARPAAELSLKAVVEAIEGPNLFRHCVFWSNTCSDERPCVMHEIWRQVRPQVADLMERTSIAELARLGGGRDGDGWPFRLPAVSVPQTATGARASAVGRCVDGE